MKTDSLFYRLFQDWPGLVLELAGLDPSAVGYTLRTEEIKQTAFRLDGVLTPPDDQPNWPLVFIETQFQSDPDFHARWFSELFLYLVPAVAAPGVASGDAVSEPGGGRNGGSGLRDAIDPSLGQTGVSGRGAG